MVRLRTCSTVLACVVIATAAHAQSSAFHPFSVDWNGAADSPASVAFLLDKPAGRSGFVRAEGGHLVQGDGKRFRIWGINITAPAAVPTKDAAPRLAAHLARFGINCVRLHFLDRPAPIGLVSANREDTQALDPAQLDRLDFFVAQLKERGIYTNLNLNVGRTYKAGDGVPDFELLGFGKAATYFHPRLIELQREYAKQLLTHRNAYTGNEYRNEPAIAIVEMVNENSLVESWFSDRLLGKATRKWPGTWTDIPASFERELTEQYNRWLTANLGPSALASLRTECKVAADAAIPRLTQSQFAAASKDRFQTEARFYMELERKFFDGIRDYLRNELAVKALLVGTADHNHGRSGYPLLASTSRLDIVDGHVYWQHPNYILDPKTAKTIGFDIPNTPMVNNPLRSTVVELSRSAVAGKPYTVSEVNHPFPHEYACEGVPILAAYAALHDWDGVFWYTLTHKHLVDEKPHGIGHFDLGPDPVKMAQIAAGAVTFLRGDVRAAKETVGRSYSTEQVYESLRLPRAEQPYFTPGMPKALPLVHAMRITSFDGAATGAIASEPAEPFVSDTNEIRWSGVAEKRGVVSVDTERSQSIVGFCQANGPSTKNLAFRPGVPFAAATLTALDDRGIATARRLLLTIAGRVANSGMVWNEKRRGLDKWGQEPPQVEEVGGQIVLRNLDGARSVDAQPLDGGGRPLGKPIAATMAGTDWRIDLQSATTVWYLIQVQR